MSCSQIKSKKRVAEHGEVFTSEREVKAMCNLVKDETERIDSRVLEPACGNGNFLAEILIRKLGTITKLYKKNDMEWEKASIIALSSLYGVDILLDNVQECKQRLFNIWKKTYKKILKHFPNTEVIDSAKYILNKNILWGDALSLLQLNGEPLVFSEWSIVNNSKIKRRDFVLAELLEAEKASSQKEATFFTDNSIDIKQRSDFAKPSMEYRPTEYWRLQCQN